MSKEFKHCPRCNTKTFINLKRCGNCGLNYDKFNNATNAEAKSAFRMGEKSRVLYTKTVPSDISKVKMFMLSLFGGWFGLHYFKIGRIWRGLVQIVGLLFAVVYSYGAITYNIRSGYLGYLILICGIFWVFTFISWLSDTLAILFKRFKYPVSLPYQFKQLEVNSSVEKNIHNSINVDNSNTDSNDTNQNNTQPHDNDNDKNNIQSNNQVINDINKTNIDNKGE